MAYANAHFEALSCLEVLLNSRRDEDGYPPCVVEEFYDEYAPGVFALTELVFYLATQEVGIGCEGFPVALVGRKREGV